jgi:hypothetical protein
MASQCSVGTAHRIGAFEFAVRDVAALGIPVLPVLKSEAARLALLRKFALDYIHKLRTAGIVIEIVREAHGGLFSGEHARYVLRSLIAILEKKGGES